MRKPKKTNTKTKAQAANSPTSAPNELVKSETAKENPESAENDSESNQSVPPRAQVPRRAVNWFRSKEKPLAIWITVLLSAVSMVIAWTYSRYEKRQWESMQASNEEVRRNREMEFRAYVVVKTVRFIPRKDMPVLGDIIVTEFNSGRTPGVGKIKATMGILTEPPPEDAPIPIPSPYFQSTIVFAPLVDVNTTVAAFPVQQPDIPVQKTAKPVKPVKPVNPPVPPTNTTEPEETNFLKDKKIYIYGRIDYVDIFKKPHWTKFCFVNTPGTETWSYCPTFNATDQQDLAEGPR